MAAAGGDGARLDGGVGSCCSISDGGSGAVALPSFSSTMRWPSLTLSPSLISSFSTIPAEGAGTSMVALSDSSDTEDRPH